MPIGRILLGRDPARFFGHRGGRVDQPDSQGVVGTVEVARVPLGIPPIEIIVADASMGAGVEEPGFLGVEYGLVVQLLPSERQEPLFPLGKH